MWWPHVNMLTLDHSTDCFVTSMQVSFWEYLAQYPDMLCSIVNNDPGAREKRVVSQTDSIAAP